MVDVQVDGFFFKYINNQVNINFNIKQQLNTLNRF